MQRSSVTIDCSVDGETVCVSHDAMARSKLVASLPHAESPLNSSVVIPFDSGSVIAWQAFAGGGSNEHTFLECVAALKVVLSCCWAPLMFAAVLHQSSCPV